MPEARTDPNAELCVRTRRFAERRAQRVPDAATWDPSSLPEPARQAARLVWARRVTNESASVEIARRLLHAARDVGAPQDVIAAASRLETDEVLHTDLARAMLERLGATAPRVEAPPPLPDEAAENNLVRLVLVGLCVCETVSAARYAEVRAHTDLEVPRACIEILLADEIQHGDLGFVLLPWALDLLAGRLGESACRDFAAAQLTMSFRELDHSVGLDAERRGLRLEPRAQPSDNPGVIEPMLDAIAFRRAIDEEIVPRLERAGLRARQAWAARFSRETH